MDKDGCGVILFVTFIAFVFGLFLGSCTKNSAWKDEMIRRGYAYYDEKTAEFTMKDAKDE